MPSSSPAPPAAAAAVAVVRTETLHAGGSGSNLAPTLLRPAAKSASGPGMRRLAMRGTLRPHGRSLPSLTVRSSENRAQNVRRRISARTMSRGSLEMADVDAAPAPPAEVGLRAVS